MPQVTIYVPKDLAEALDRNRERLNVSQICAQALRQEVSKVERMATAEGELQAIIERLRAERGRSTTYEDVREYARRRAEAWAKRAHYDQLRYYGELEVGADPDHYYATEFSFPEDGEEDAAEDYRDDREEKRLSFDWGTYCRAWHEQVQAFWQRIKDQL